MFTNAESAREFMLAGNAYLTFKSRRTGEHMTFRVRRASGSPRWFVSTKVASDHYAYVGHIDESHGFYASAKSPPPELAFRAFRYAWGWITQGIIPGDLEVRHDGRCGRCARQLTHPESIDRGIGPECSKFL